MTDTTFSPAAPASAARPVALAAGVRISEVDMLRGLVIVLMALDHVRDYFHAGAFTFDPLNPAQTTPLIYATRWVTHFCAPTFVFLAGVSAWLQFAKGKTTPKLSMFLLTRGLWLIALEVTVLSFGWSFAFPYPFFLQVIWAIGWSMIALAGLVWLPRMAVLAVGLAIVAGHNLLDPITPQDFGSAALVWTLLHDGGPIFVNGAPVGLAAYPILPWVGVMAFGYGMGALIAEPPDKRDRMLISLGLAMIALFLLLRGFNHYGNPPPVDQNVGPFGASRAWQDQEGVGAMIMAFLDVQKYPPSLMFVLVTLGPMFVLLPLLAKLRGAPAGVLLTFGAVPFFFYVLHVYLVHGLAIVANAATGRDPSGLFNYLVNSFVAPELLQPLGFPIGVVYLAWIVVLALLYPLCRYWQGLKARRRDWWLSYL
jgi:uncharacterized membrane protein